MYYLITYDDGHGMETAGKRTPLFPDGTFMLENEFNRACAEYFVEKLKYTPNVILFNVSPEITDVPLKTRTDRANAKLAELQKLYGAKNIKAVHISFHANAYLGKWGEWGGQGVFYYPTSSNGKVLAQKILDELVKNTQLRNRGIKGADFHMLRETKMVSALVEVAFMDNLQEAKLLRDDKFRRESGEEIAQGVANFMGFQIVAPPAPKETAPEGMTYRVHAGSFQFKENADVRVAELKAKGFPDAYIKLEDIK